MNSKTIVFVNCKSKWFGVIILVRFDIIPQTVAFFSLCRYELPAPSSGQKNDISAWQECVNNSMAQLEHQAVRIENLELMSQFGTNAWKVYNEYVAAGPI